MKCLYGNCKEDAQFYPRVEFWPRNVSKEKFSPAALDFKEMKLCSKHSRTLEMIDILPRPAKRKLEKKMETKYHWRPDWATARILMVNEGEK